jgi:glycosyltransferase involved in cell wall biosynthesis
MAAGPAGYVRLNDMLKIGTNAPFNANEDEAFKVLSKPQSEFLNSRITRVGNAKRLDSYPLTRIEKRKRKDEFRLLYIGVLEKHPSRGIIETAITVNKMKGIQFDIGGFGTLVPTIKRICEKMDNVNYIGSIHPDNVPLQTIESDAVLMALDPKNDNNRMSAPNKLFEAMSAGVPVITCKELLMGKFVENEEIGLTFEWGKWDRLKAAIMKLVYDKELQEKMGRRGRKLAEKTHNWGKCEDRIDSLDRYVKLNAVNPS